MNKIPKIILIVVIGFLFIWLPVIPVNVVPEITLKVVDTDKKPMPGVTVTQSWMHYSFESTSSVYKDDHNDKVVSDTSGLVTFSEKNIKISVFKFLLGKIAEILYKIVPAHTSVGPSSPFFVVGYDWVDVPWCYPKCPNGEIPKEIVIKEKVN